METKVIAISRALGAGGEEIGRALATELGFRYVDAEIIAMAAERVGASPEEVARAEGRKGLLGRIVESLARANLASPEVPPAPTDYESALGPNYPQVIVDVVKEVATEGDCVLVAHGASYALGPAEGVLRLLVTGSAEARAARLFKDSHGPARARQEVADSDIARSEFLKRFYDVDRETPDAYDLVINTDRLSHDEAVKLVLAVARG